MLDEEEFEEVPSLYRAAFRSSGPAVDRSGRLKPGTAPRAERFATNRAFLPVDKAGPRPYFGPRFPQHPRW